MVRKNKGKAVQNPEKSNLPKLTSFSQPIKSWIDIVSKEEKTLTNQSPEKQL